MKVFTPDMFNGFFEIGGAILLLLNVKRLARDKSVHGVSVIPVIFFTAWGFWNLFYYPQLGQWFSFIGGICVVVVNSAWLLQVYHYSERGQR